MMGALRKLRGRHVIVGVVAFALLGLVAGFAPFVRGRAREVASRYGAEVDIEWVLPAWGGVTLRGVTVRHPDAPGFRVVLDSVRVGWSSPRTVAIRGGTIDVTGSVDEILAQVERVRARLPRREGDGDGGRSTEITVEGIALSHAAEGASFQATGLRASRAEGGITVGVDAAKWTARPGSLEAQAVELVARKEDEAWRVGSLRAAGVSVRVDLDAGEGAAGAAVAAAGRAARLGAVRARLMRLESEAARALTADTKIDLEGVRAQIVRGSEQLALGPATVRLRREGGRTSIEYRAGAAVADLASEDGLVVKAKLPIEAEPFAVEVRGGPISLGTLGVRQGDLHLIDPDAAHVRMNARVEVDEHGEVGSFDGEASVSDLGFQVDELAKEPVRGLRASFRGKVRGALDGSNLSVQGGELEIGNVRLVASFDVVREQGTPRRAPQAAASAPAAPSPRYKVGATFEVPLVPCQALLDAAPSGLLPHVEGMRLAGSFSLKGKAKIDTETLDKDFALDYDIASSCRVTDVPPQVDVERFKKPFKLQVYGPGGERELELETGPGSANWAPYNAISRFMEPAVMTCEDGRFHRHEGFDHEAIRNSLRENIRQRKFVRGASTITMQLAKNLYLARDKRLGRKIEEAFLTMYLEQALTKEQILELYLNVVELGPKVYGIEAGAQHYFRTSPSRLTLSQAFYLASILPGPQIEHFGAGGGLSKGWLNNLRTLMKHANKVKRLSDEDLEVGLAEVPLRGSPSPMRDPEAGPAPPDKDEGVIQVDPQ